MMYRKFSAQTILLAGILIIASCSMHKQAAAPEAAPMEAPEAAVAEAAPMEAASSGVTYSGDIQPLMMESCSPCHFPAKGKKEMLHTFAATVKHMDDIIYRIQLPTDSTEFMPYKSKRDPLTAEQIQLFLDWRDAGTPE